MRLITGLLAAGLPVSLLATDVPLNPDRLWLPLSQSEYQRQLLQAADIALASERCTEVLRGQLDQAASTPELPAFAIVCRDENRRTYVERIVGLELQRPEPQPEVEPPAPVAEVDKTPIEQAIYGQCQQLWQESAAVLKGVQWLDGWHDWTAQSVQTVALDDGQTVDQYHYQREFDAVNQDGIALHYSALCEGRSVESLSVKILPRRAAD